ncbi:MAG: hypothetical protein ACLQU2_19650 [Candidatus Binataceae bacterium]
MTDPRVKMLIFTGSAKVGWMLQAKAAPKRVPLELETPGRVSKK